MKAPSTPLQAALVMLPVATRSPDDGPRIGDVTIDGLTPIWEPGDALPVRFVLDGRPVVLIEERGTVTAGDLRDLPLPFVVLSVAEYDALRAAGQKVAPPLPRRLSRIERDAEVRRFIEERFGTEQVEDIRQAIIARFGSDRAPSRSGISRYAQRLRRANLGP